VNWRGFLFRILLVAVAFPVLGVLILVLPQEHHLGFNIVVVLATLAGAFETAGLFKARKIPTSTRLAPILALTLPAGAWLQVAGFLPAGWMGIWIPAALCVLLVRSVLFAGTKDLPGVLGHAASSVFTLLYPSFFLAYIVRITGLPEPSLSVLFFLCLVFGNDMAAYFAGSLWGETTRLNLPVSPRKSVVGFAAGLLGSLIILALFRLITPGFPRFPLGLSVVLSLAVGVTVIVGDLLESGLKRSAGVKDSGVVIPGRGGLLDSVDSMVLSAPLFYYIFRLLLT
jgi:phosphatidate cytidylyltransferase